MQPRTPGTPDSVGGFLISAAGYAANDKRNNRSIMNCFRDRTPGYNNNNNNNSNNRNFMRYEQSVGVATNRSDPGAATRTEAVVLLKELRTRPNKLALLKSTSQRDLTRLVEMNFTSIDITSNTPSSSSSTASSSPAVDMKCTGKCLKYIEQLQERVTQLETQVHEQRTYTRDLEFKLNNLVKCVTELSDQRPVEKQRKKNVNKKLQRQQQISPQSSSSGSSGGGGSNNNNNNVQPSKFVAWMNLTNWWKHRPSIETLKEQNIYNNEPCFDTELEMVLKHESHKTIPRIVVDCCDIIEDKYRKSSEPIEGIYRQCGDYNKIQSLRFKIDANDYEALRQPNIDIHTLTGVLKLFLREIKSPLISTNEVKTFIGQPNQWLLTELSTKIDILKRLIRSLPEVNRDTMEYLFKHFNKLTKIPLQQISAETLSLSITPSIFHAVQKGANHTQDLHLLLRENELLNDCVKTMIEYQIRIFECDDERRRRRISIRRLRKTLSQPDLLFQNIF